MDFDPARTDLIEAVLLPLDEQTNARAALKVAVAWASESNLPAGIGEATNRLRGSAQAFRLATKGSSLLMALSLLLVLWLSLLRPQALEAFSSAELSGRAILYLSAMDEIQAPPLLPRYGFRLPSIVGIPPDATWQEMYERQKARMGGKGTILNPLFSAPLSRSRDSWRDASLRARADPALYFRSACIAGRDPSTGEILWPADLVDAGEKLDPGNGLFRLLHAIEISGQAVGRDFSPKVVDSTELIEALEELEKASSLPRWDDYRQLGQRESIDWPPARDYPEQVFSLLTFIKSVPDRVRIFGSEKGLINAWVRAAAADPDPAVLAQVEQRFTSLCRRWASIATSSFGRDFQKDLIQAGAESFSTAYSARGETAKAAHYAAVLAAMNRFDIPYDPAGFYAYGLLDIRTMEFGGLSSEPEKRAGRMAEYAMWERIAFHFTAIILALLGGILLLAPRWTGQNVGPLPVRLTSLLKRGDRALIFLVGGAVPMAIYFGCTRLLPGREEYISLWKFLLMLSQALGMIWSMLFGSAALVRWLLLRRGAAALGFRRGHLRIDIVFAAVPLVMIPVACFTPGVLAPIYQEPYEGGVASFILVLPLLWAAIRALSWFASLPEKRLLQATLMRACAPVICTAAVIAATAILVLHAWESRLVTTWTAGSALTPELLGTGPAQQQRAEQIRQAILKSLEP